MLLARRDSCEVQDYPKMVCKLDVCLITLWLLPDIGVVLKVRPARCAYVVCWIAVRRTQRIIVWCAPVDVSIDFRQHTVSHNGCAKPNI